MSDRPTAGTARPLPVLNALVVGCGQIAGGYDSAMPQRRSAGVFSHAGAYRAHPGFRLLGCVEPDTARRTAFMEHWGIPQGFADLEAALASGTVFDVVSVCSPDHAHTPQLERLLHAPVRGALCEKPMTTDPVRGAAVAAAWTQAGKTLLVNYSRRFAPGIRALAAELESGVWGPVQHVTATYTKGIRHNGAHMVDLLRFLLGPLTDGPVLRSRPDYRPDDPTVDAVLYTAAGAPVYLVGAGHEHYALFEAQIVTPCGRIDMEDFGFRLRRQPVEDSRRFPGFRQIDAAGTVTDTGLDQALPAAVDALYQAVAYGTVPPCGGVEAVAAEHLCDSLRRKALSLPPERTIA
ncbi:putative dehydrogenase [Azospirillum fermentarium]|uniref:Gfo/Idh/MocA family protein n=1 Tax=Azospirillum fermentarium TaxID=1233114 RepID=UPI00222805CC|nr:Gfo/Idh/MocA family oxidoreductase [Azospirillum fermentarium]MCW2249528.1 putative dehydrogenase [Azospirillum fermentarium]